MATKKDLKKPKRRVGRPTLYTEDLGNEICDVIASNPNGLSTLCRERPHWPDPANIFIWRRKYPDFRDKYTRAKEDQVEASVNLMQEIMDEEHHYVDDNGNIRIDVSMLRVKYDAIKWQASKLAPKKYGDKNEFVPENSLLLEDSLQRKHELDEKNKKEF